jgi:aryl-alcohol dehydrogenase-like predicted oxidoreductase
MERVQFGKTDLWVTRIGLGLAALTHKMLELAFQKGIHYEVLP